MCVIINRKLRERKYYIRKIMIMYFSSINFTVEFRSKIMFDMKDGLRMRIAL